VVFSLFGASLLALLAAVVARIGFGRPLPFGPFLVMGAAGWMFGGWRLFAWYLEFLAPVWQG
jgi:leader peptidase (prepilin peptidase)/N-methyltransferase